MRNDARPIGEQSPAASHESPVDDRGSDEAAPVVNRADEEKRRDDEDRDPVMPADESTVKTKI